METYLWKLVVCSAIFIGIYFAIFERQKNHHFKRFYLLMSLLFSLFIPLISITYGVQEVKAQDFVILETGGEITPSVQEKPSVFTLENTLGAVYLLVSAILIFRLCRNLFIFVQETKKGEKIKFGNHFLILKPNAVHPYSFWNFIVLNKTDFENGKIDEKILIHEKAHLDQKHSLDVLFMEILLAVFWFNLAFYLYKKAIITNHEFLADDTVLKTENNIKSYQKLLLSELISERILFTHPFNLSNTKKRIKMMTTPKNNTGKYLSWISLPLSALLFFIFVEKVPAQIDKSKKTDVAVPVDENKMTAEEKELYKKLKEGQHQVIDLRNKNPNDEFYKVLGEKRMQLLKEGRYKEFGSGFTQEEKIKLNDLFWKMTPAQKEASPILVFNRTGLLEKKTVTNAQLKDFQNTEKYGVWLDGKKIQNHLLKKYSSVDFSSVFVSKRYKNARSGDHPEPFQVNLMTNAYFKEVNEIPNNIAVGIKNEFYKDHPEKNDTIRPNNFENRPKEAQNIGLSSNEVDQLPEFPGGLNAFRSKIAMEFNSAIFNGDEGLLRANINYTITETGKLDLIVLSEGNKKFNDEIGRVLMKIGNETTWKPALKDGKPVRYRMRLPMTMNFESNPGIKKN